MPSTATIPRPSSRETPSPSSLVTSVLVSLNDFPCGISPSLIASDDRLGERLDLEVELVVLVRGLALERAPGMADELPVDDDRLRGLDLDLVVVDDPVLRDLEVELAHAGEQVLAGLLVDLDPEAGVLLPDLPHDLDEFRQVGHSLRLDGHGDDRLGDVADLLERRHVLGRSTSSSRRTRR